MGVVQCQAIWENKVPGAECIFYGSHGEGEKSDLGRRVCGNKDKTHPGTRHNALIVSPSPSRLSGPSEEEGAEGREDTQPARPTGRTMTRPIYLSILDVILGNWGGRERRRKRRRRKKKGTAAKKNEKRKGRLPPPSYSYSKFFLS